MSVKEIESFSNQRNVISSNRLLGNLGMLGALMLFAEMVVRALMNEPEKLDERFVGLLGVFYIGGWIATAIAMRKLKVTGEGNASRIVFILQMVGLILAFLFSVQELFGQTYATGGVFWKITDIAYPFSHVFMIVVGVLVWRARVWKGSARIAPLFVGLMLPMFVAFALTGTNQLGAVIATGSAAIGFVIIALTVRSGISNKENIAFENENFAAVSTILAK
jgi:hypothetical protein